MKKLLTIGISAILTSYCVNVSAQEKKLTELTQADFIADYRLAIEILKKQHPNPYKFIDSITLERKLDSLMKEAANAPNVLASMRYSPVYLVKDVHTNLSISGDNFKEAYRQLHLFPFPILIERGKIFVNQKGVSIPFGAEIIAINGMSALNVLRSVENHAYSDGFITTGVDRAYPNFQVNFSLIDPSRQAFQISYIVPGSKEVKKMELPASAPAPTFHSSRQAIFPVNLLQRAYLVYCDFIDEQQTGLLTVNTFNLNEAVAYKEFSEFFREVKKRKYAQVIIDIRSNGGGNPAISALLYSFLAKGPFPNIYNYRTRTIDFAFPEYAITDDGRRLSDDDIRNNRNFLYQRFDKDSSGFYIGNARLKEGLLENFPPDKDAFDGKVYVLTGGGTVSAATYFASLVQKNKRGEVIGKETGSGEAVTTAAWFLKYLLPRTKSILTVPMAELFFFNASTDKGRGLLPDREIPLPKFVEYIQAGKDPEITYTLDLIRTSSNSTDKR